MIYGLKSKFECIKYPFSFFFLLSAPNISAATQKHFSICWYPISNIFSIFILCLLKGETRYHMNINIKSFLYLIPMYFNVILGYTYELLFLVESCTLVNLNGDWWVVFAYIWQDITHFSSKISAFRIIILKVFHLVEP